MQGYLASALDRKVKACNDGLAVAVKGHVFKDYRHLVVVLGAGDLELFGAFKIFKKALLFFDLALVSLLKILGKRHEFLGFCTFICPSEMVLGDLGRSLAAVLISLSL